MARIRLSCCMVLILISAVVPTVDAEDALEQAAKRLEGKLMSPCCMSGTVADHSSPIAFEMKAEIRAMLAEGKSERDVLDHYVALHTQQILAIPDATGFNLTAYTLPLMFLVLGLGGVALMLRRWRTDAPTREPVRARPAVDPAYRERLQRELRDLD